MSKIQPCAVIIFSLLALLSFSVSASTSPKVEDIIILNTPEYDTREETLVSFNHQKHLAVKSTGGYGISCGECHHDEDGLPLEELQMEDVVDRCVECHSNTGKKPKGEKLSKRQEIREYHKKSLHANCRNCHGKFNKKNNLKKNDPGAAPMRCKGCHLEDSKN